MIGSYPLRALVMAAVILMPVLAHAERMPLEPPMTFKLATNSERDIAWISAIGVITVNTPAAFEKFVKTVERKGLWIEFHSPGGKVVPALRLGDLIRQGGFNTDVAQTVFHGPGRDRLAPGFCLSACAYAFLGGIKRDVQENSLLGYHQFFKDPNVKIDPKTDEYATKIITAYIARYLERMGIDAQLLTLAMATKPTDYYEPDDGERVKLRIVTGGKAEAEADSEPIADPDVDTDPGPEPKASLGKHSDAGAVRAGVVAAA